jgi:hypothetical protein
MLAPISIGGGARAKPISLTRTDVIISPVGEAFRNEIYNRGRLQTKHSQLMAESRS